MTKSPIAFAVLTLIVGGAVGYLVGASQTEPVAATSGAQASQPASPTKADADPSKPARAATSGRSAGARPKSDAADSTGTGDGTITGDVVGPDGAPLAGVLVRAEASGTDEERDEEAQPAAPPGSPPPRKDVDRELRKFETRLRQEESRVRETTTDAHGSYVLNGLVGGVFDVNAWLVGYRIERSDGKSCTVLSDGGRCDFKATPLHALSVTVLLPDGSPAKYAQLSWRSTAGGEGRSSARRPDASEISVEAGTYTIAIEPGTYTFTATAGPQDQAPAATGRGRWSRRITWNGELRRSKDDEAPLYRSEPRTIAVGADGPRTLTIRLAGQPAIRAKVVFASADRPDVVRIAAVKSDAGSPADPSALLGEGARVKARWLQGEDETILTGLEPGTYLVGVTFRGGLVGASESVNVGTDVATATLEVGGGIRDWVKVWVCAPDGSLVRDAKIDCGCKGSEGGGDWHLDAVPEADGSFHVHNFEHDGPYVGSGGGFGGSRLGDGKRTYYVRANSAVYGSAEAAYDPATDREVSVQFVEPARLRVSIAGYAESPDRSRIMVSLDPKDEDVSGRQSTQDGEIDAGGVATFPPLKPGPYEVVLTLAKDAQPGESRWRSRWDGAEVARIPTYLRAGDDAVNVAAPTVIDLVVAFDAGLDPKSIELQRVADDGALARIAGRRPDDGEHEVAFRDLVVVAGRYRLVSRSVGDMWIDLPGTTRVAFRPRPFNSLQVRMTGYQEGYLAEAGFQEGDVVIVVDGTDCQDVVQMDALLAVAKTHDKATLTVLRGGRRIDVSVDPKRLDDGGHLAPWVR